MMGIVKCFNEARGFGFFEHESDPDVFAHFRVISGTELKTPQEGQKAGVTVSENENGPQAEDINVVN